MAIMGNVTIREEHLRRALKSKAFQRRKNETPVLIGKQKFPKGFEIPK